MIRQQTSINIALSVFGIGVGLLICFADPNTLLKFVLTIIGIIIICHAIRGLFMMRLNLDEKEKDYFMISSIISIVIGIFLIVYHQFVATIIAGVFLIALPIYRIIKEPNHLQALKNEAIKLILGVILILCGVGYVVKVLLYIVGGFIILVSLIYMIYNITLSIKSTKQSQKNKQENDVIDV